MKHRAKRTSGRHDRREPLPRLHQTNIKPSEWKPGKNEEKSRAIFVPHSYSQEHKPKHFSLPSFESIKDLLRRKPHKKIYFAKLDVSNFFYWSIELPPHLIDKFNFTYNNNTYTYTRLLPFGWDYSPAIAQHIITKIITPCKYNNVHILIYLDDQGQTCGAIREVEQVPREPNPIEPDPRHRHRKHDATNLRG
eukprot:GEZU01009145.1.p1 GENE.GEZU01009145.1~~GEZU01009145.1.p1  ORF type:complete len:193 (-),score=21.30 GEZU01009145.1:97-675(-)